MIRYYTARVRSGRLVLEEPATDLPDLTEGTPVELVWIEDIRIGGDLFEAAEQAALDRELDASIAEADAGQAIDCAEALAELRAKPQEGCPLHVTTVQRSRESGAIPISCEDHALRNRHAQSFDNVRQLLARASAFAHAQVDLFNQATPAEDGEARRRREHFAHLTQGIAEAVDDAREAGDQIAAALNTHSAGMTPGIEETSSGVIGAELRNLKHTTRFFDACVRNGRLVLDALIDLPENTILKLMLLDLS